MSAPPSQILALRWAVFWARARTAVKRRAGAADGPDTSAPPGLMKGARASARYLTGAGSLGAGLAKAERGIRVSYRPPWAEKSYATQLAVPPLSAQDSVQVAQAVLGHETAPPPLAEALLARAQGNPCSIEELARALVEEGVSLDGPTAPVDLPAVLAAWADPAGWNRLQKTCQVTYCGD